MTPKKPEKYSYSHYTTDVSQFLFFTIHNNYITLCIEDIKCTLSCMEMYTMDHA